MAPDGAAGVDVREWPGDDGTGIEPGDVVVEMFGCHLPGGFVARMAQRAPAPVWINLEYLSAENYVERSHGLTSPQSGGAAAGLRKWFFFPGFTAATGGLLREPDLLARHAAFDAGAWRLARGIPVGGGERCVSLFCYENPAVPALLDALSAEPTLLLVTPGLAARQVREALGSTATRGALRAHYLPELTQRDYDHLLWACDLNLVRGEDSFVRAQWAGRPFLWQIYPQRDGVHAAKLEAFNRRFLEGAPGWLADAVADVSRRWNGLGDPARPVLPPAGLFGDWRRHCEGWRERVAQLTDLTTALRAFVAKHR
jgi:uncharacterized repeat protein (TIGR03837 family)